MQQITSSKKYQDGVLRIPGDAGKDVNDFFSYEDLVDQKINAFDLLMHPGICRIYPDLHRIESTVNYSGGMSEWFRKKFRLRR